MRPTPAQLRADFGLAAVLFVGALISAFLSSVSGIWGEEQAGFEWAVIYAFALAVPLAVRRRWPATVAVMVSAAYFIAVTTRIPEIYAGNIAVFIALYTVGAWSTSRRRAHLTRVGIIVGMFMWLLIMMFRDATLPAEELEEMGMSTAGAFSPFVAYSLLNLLINALYFGGAYYFGERSFQQMRDRRALEERTAELEREREVSAAQAVTLDRVRIARELHDVVAHHVSLMGVQAGAARALLAADPEQSKGMLTNVEASAREALRELRQLLETLREPDAALGADGILGDDPDAAPTTRKLAALPALVAEATTAGLPTSLTIVGKPVPLPPLVEVNLYRIAQEALTNARRHAGPEATADVRLRYSSAAVELEVTNTGRIGTGSPGLGQLGMRERAAASGGTIEIGPRARGGYLVRLHVPLMEKVPMNV